MPTNKRKFEEEKSSTHVECALYVFHHVAHKAKNANETMELCKGLRDRLMKVTSMTWSSIEELRKNLIDDEKYSRGAHEDKRDKYTMQLKFLAEMKKEKTINELRSCINILGMTEVLLARKISFTGDESVNLSWKEARKPSVLGITNVKYPKVQDRRDRLKFLPKASLDCLKFDSICKLNKSQALALVDLGEAQLRNEDGEFTLHEDTKIGMLFWKMTEKEIRKFADLVSWEDFTGAIRDQEFHLLCAAYVATDLVSCSRYMHKLEDKNIPLCTWCLCAYTDSKALGKDPRAKPGHHCYGSSIENFLCHIQAHGVPREIFSKFDCRNHHPPTANDPWNSLRKIKVVRRIPTFEQAMRELRKRPLGADLLHYSGMFDLGNQIYYGPHQQSSALVGYHGVFIEGTKIMNGELVAVCKLSNGPDQGDEGYVYVSLATLYFPVSAVMNSQMLVRGLSQPSHLLSNFVSIELEGEEKKEEKPEERRRQDHSSDKRRQDHSSDKRRQDHSSDKRRQDTSHKRLRSSTSRSER